MLCLGFLFLWFSLFFYGHLFLILCFLKSTYLLACNTPCRVLSSWCLSPLKYTWKARRGSDIQRIKISVVEFVSAAAEMLWQFRNWFKLVALLKENLSFLLTESSAFKIHIFGFVKKWVNVSDILSYGWLKESLLRPPRHPTGKLFLSHQMTHLLLEPSYK